MQRPMLSLGSMSSGDRKDSTFSSNEPSSSKRSTSSWNRRLLSSYCHNTFGKTNECQNTYICSYQWVCWRCQAPSAIRAKHYHGFSWTTILLQLGHRHCISWCMNGRCRGCRTWRGASGICSSWTISSARGWAWLLSLLRCLNHKQHNLHDWTTHIK